MKVKLFKANLFLLISPALIGLLLFGFFVINDNLKINVNIIKINSIIQLNIVNNRLIHELQKERGMSTGLIRSGGISFVDSLAQQRKLTDQALKKRQQYLQQNKSQIVNLEIKSILHESSLDLSQLKRMRASVDDFNITVEEITDYYSRVNTNLINIILPTIKLANRGEVANLLQAYYNLIQGKELAGLERALVVDVFTQQEISRRNLSRYISLVAVQSAYFDTFQNISDAQLLTFYQQAMQHQAVAKVSELRQLVFNNADLAKLTTDSVQWFESATQRINQLKKIEDKTIEKLQALTVRVANKSELMLIVSICYSLLAIILTMVLLVKLRKSAQIQQQQQQLLHKFGLAVENSPNSVMITNSEGLIEYTNNQFSQMTEYERGEVKGVNPKSFKAEQTEQTTFDEIETTLNNGERWQGELLNKKKSGNLYWAKTSIFPVVSDQGKTLHHICLQEDITKQREAQEQIKYLANHDELTGLPSLRLGKDRLEQAILSAQRHKLAMALMFIDLDGFKTINDIHGHAAGDAILKEISSRMAKELRSTDTIARIGGDEFMAILTNVKDPKVLDTIASKLISTIKEPFYYQNTALTVAASIGIVLSPKHGTTSQELLKKADCAMYKVKKSGKDSFSYYCE